MKITKTDPRTILIGKHVLVRRSSYMLKYRIDTLNGNMFEGVIVEASENSPFEVGTTYSVSENEIKYHSIIS